MGFVDVAVVRLMVEVETRYPELRWFSWLQLSSMTSMAAKSAPCQQRRSTNRLGAEPHTISHIWGNVSMQCLSSHYCGRMSSVPNVVRLSI
jgi:hypothetical protein